MPASDYILNLRRRIGSDLLLLPSVAAVIQSLEGQVLFQRQSHGQGWSLPAGAIEPSESPEQAVRREVLEETGRTVLEATLLAAFGGTAFRHRYPNGDQVEYSVLLYRCSVDDHVGQPSDGETEELQYFDRAHAPKLALPYPEELIFKR